MSETTSILVCINAKFSMKR